MKHLLGLSTILATSVVCSAALAARHTDAEKQTEAFPEQSAATDAVPSAEAPQDNAPAAEEAKLSAPAKPEATLAFVANPIALLFNEFNLDVGVAVADKTSANFSGSYWSFSILGVKNTAWGLGVGGQYFFYGDRFHGAFVYPALEYAKSTISAGDYESSGSLFGPSAIVGYQWNWHPFTLRLGGGGRYYLGSVGGDGFKSDLQGFAVKLDASIGLAF